MIQGGLGKMMTRGRQSLGLAGIHPATSVGTCPLPKELRYVPRVESRSFRIQSYKLGRHNILLGVAHRAAAHLNHSYKRSRTISLLPTYAPEISDYR